MNSRLTRPFAWADSAEAGTCLRLNRMSRLRWPRAYFRAVSRLGNGAIWCALLAAILLAGGWAEFARVAQMGVTALLGVWIYKGCKKRLARERPFVTHKQIACVGRPLDRGSFPSGHTLHAACFSVMCAAYYPGLLWAILPLAASIALSRVVLGHHYPSDVLAGGLIGCALARFSLMLMPLA